MISEFIRVRANAKHTRKESQGMSAIDLSDGFTLIDTMSKYNARELMNTEEAVRDLLRCNRYNILSIFLEEQTQNKWSKFDVTLLGIFTKAKDWQP